MADRVETFRIDGWDEDGFHFSVGTDEDDHRFRITDTEVARAFISAVAPTELEPLAEWVAESDRQHVAYMAASAAERARVLGRPLELDVRRVQERAEAMREHGDHLRKADREGGRP